MRKTFLVTAIIVFCAATLAQADISITKSGGDETTVEYYTRTQHSSWVNGQIESIIDLKKDTITTVNHDLKIYTTAAFPEYSSTLKAFFQQAMDRMKSDPQAAQFLEMTKQFAAGLKTELIRADEETISGYPCRKYNLLVNGNKTVEYWVSDKVEKEISAVFPLAELHKFEQEITRIQSESMPWLAASDPDTLVRDKGYVVIQKQTGMVAAMGMAESSSAENTRFSISKAMIGSEKMKTPKNYTLVPLRQFLLADEN